jgi:4,5-DOPA dioxygenase extradiol
MVGMSQPVLFVAHGAPPLLDDAQWMGELAAWGKALARPTAIVSISAHWEARPVTIGATRPLPLIYDFFGFPEKYYKIQYPAPGAPAVAARIAGLLDAAKIPHASDETRGLDHGTYIPLMSMFPNADVPVIQVSLPSMAPKELLALGAALAPLRAEGVLIMTSGFITHNLRALGMRELPAWATDFDAWTADVVGRGDVDALLDYRTRAPGVRESLPTHEHYVPLIVAAGAAQGAAAVFPITVWWWGPMTKRSVQFG